MENTSAATIRSLLAKYQVIVWIIATTLTCISMTFFIIYPQTMEYLSLNQTISSNQSQIQLLTQKLDNLKKISLAEYKRSYTTLLQALPKERDLLPAIATIQNVVIENNLQILTVGFSSGSTSQANTDSFIINLELSGRLNDIKNFASQINQSPRLMKLNSIDISTDRKTGNYHSAIAIQVLYNPSPDASTEIDTPIDPLSQQDLNLINDLSTSLPAISSEPTSDSPSVNFEGVNRDDPFN